MRLLTVQFFTSAFRRRPARHDSRPRGSSSSCPVVRFRWDLAENATAARDARRRIATALSGWGLQALIDEVQLAASELVSNAVRYGGAPIHLTLSHDHGCRAPEVRLEVSDGGRTPLRRSSASDDPLATGGRGLLIVAHLAAQWGVSTGDRGATVWCRFSAPAPAAGAGDHPPRVAPSPPPPTGPRHRRTRDASGLPAC